jgi:hypothetical protein
MFFGLAILFAKGYYGLAILFAKGYFGSTFYKGGKGGKNIIFI